MAEENTITVNNNNSAPEIVIDGLMPSTPSSSTQSTRTSDQPKQESVYGNIQAIPTQEAIEGIRFDFNQGIRIFIPNNDKEYHIEFSDMDAGCVLFSSDAKPGVMVTSTKKFFIKFKLVIYHKGDTTPIFTHEYNAKDKEVMVQLPVGTIGDSVGWFSYLERFQKKHQCKLIAVMNKEIADLFKDQYPDIKFITKEKTAEYKPYATYYLGLFFKGDIDWQPVDFRFAGNHRTASFILDVNHDDIAPRVNLSAKRTIKEKYVVIATQASSQCKYWNNPNGWHALIEWLHKQGYKVVCIDREHIHGTGLMWNHMPYGVDYDLTGDKPLQERIDIIKDAEFFVGLSSGLSWLAWCCKVPVVLISGFTQISNEFYTPYRVINYHVCNGCWNDFRVEFDHYDFTWCPRHKGDDKQFSCSRMISAEHVINVIKTIPGFA